ncbi:hypothetical protein Baya_15004 [Bagarius yarrelli]|uniref:Uncharacterized protein n=1 Tax=Bagarius yarrelli TaxID=175774 RepID=A0A556VAK8_BAGYA|nr:hypothetical protein Baya_15004 [Bagarius yarrelli]
MSWSSYPAIIGPGDSGQGQRGKRGARRGQQRGKRRARRGQRGKQGAWRGQKGKRGARRARGGMEEHGVARPERGASGNRVTSSAEPRATNTVLSRALERRTRSSDEAATPATSSAGALSGNGDLSGIVGGDPSGVLSKSETPAASWCETETPAAPWAEMETPAPSLAGGETEGGIRSWPEPEIRVRDPGGTRSQ